MSNSINVYVVGDSTLASFKDYYFYPRYGYGTQLGNFFNDNVHIINIAISGRSSRSYIKEDNYKYLLENLNKGDYLIIGFGHNDEKDEDPNRFTTANKDMNDNSSYAYYLYTYYIKVAKDRGAYPILCTPIVRADKNNDYTANSYHITRNGDYRMAAINLAKNTDTTLIDLCLLTKNLYKELGYDKAIYFHAWPKSKKETVDTTHLNIYGAKMVSYLFATALKESSSSLASYLKNTLIKPNQDDDLISNPDYIELPYKSFNKDEYKPTPNFNIADDEWSATAFGDNGSNPLLESTGYFVKKANNGFIIGQNGEFLKGRIGNTEGVVVAFKMIHKDDNFIINCDALVTEKKVDFEAGFGVMLRDDIYINQAIPDSSILSNYVACGFYNDNEKTNIIYSRENKKLINKGYSVSYYQVGDKANLELERLGQVVNLKVIYKGQTYTATYTDFDFLAVDNEYMYLCLYATKGTVVEFDNIEYKYLGKSQGA